MTSSSLVMFTVAVATVSLLALVAVFAVYFTARGPARAGLGSVGVTAALVGPVAGIGAASYAMIQSFSVLELTGAGGAAAMRAACAEAALPLRVGFASAALTLVVASGLAWIGRHRPAPLRFASAGRMVVLALPGVLAFLLVGGALESSRRTRDIILDVVAAPAPAEGATTPETSGSIAEISRRLGSGLMAGVVGVLYLFLVLIGFAAATAILAWRVQVPTAFAAVSSAWMLLQAALWTAAIFLWRIPVPGS